MIKGKRFYFCEIKIDRQKTLFYPERKIDSPKKVYELAKTFIGDADREELLVITLNTKNEINAVQIASKGSLNNSIATPREILKLAILTNSASFIICHNHPSGVVEPSREDCLITERIKRCSEMMDIKLLDHIIVGENRFISLKDKGIL